MVPMKIFAGQESTYGHREWTCGHRGRSGGWTETGALTYRHHREWSRQWEAAIKRRGLSAVLCGDLDGWDSGGAGRKVQDREDGVGVCSLLSDFVTPCAVACQATLPMQFSRQEYCSGLPFPATEDLPYPGIKPMSSCIGRRILYGCTTWDIRVCVCVCVCVCIWFQFITTKKRTQHYKAIILLFLKIKKKKEIWIQVGLPDKIQDASWCWISANNEYFFRLPWWPKQ